MVVYGTKGIMEFSIHGDSKIILKKDETIKEYNTDIPQVIQENMIEEVVSEILTGKKKNTCYGDEAIETYRVMDEVLKDYYGGRDNEFWKNFKI